MILKGLKTLLVKFSASNLASNATFVAGGNGSGTCEQNIYVHASRDNTIPKIAAKLRAALASLTTVSVNGVSLSGYTISEVGGTNAAQTITLTGHEQVHNFTFSESADSNSVFSATSLLWRTGSLLPINGRSIMVSENRGSRISSVATRSIPLDGICENAEVELKTISKSKRNNIIIE